MALIDETHDPMLGSWVQSADKHPDFPIQNLPLATFVVGGKQRIGTAIGDSVLDLQPWMDGSDLGAFFRLSSGERTQLRHDVSRALRSGAGRRPLYQQSECQFLLPGVIGDYSDFYASLHHARNVGALFRPDHPLLPNYRHVPIAYHGRVSSIVPSGTPVTRPSGQLGEGCFGATAELDYEVELGAFIGPGNGMGTSIPLCEAERHVAGLCLLNDWSAREIQRWEYQPLGPFLGKNFATTISPWVITADALAPFAVSPWMTDRVEPRYLRLASGQTTFDIEVEAWIRVAGSTETFRLSRANFRDMYWTWAQMIAHHTVNGCPLRAGDLIGSGTISGAEPENRGCLLELTEKGRNPIQLPDGSRRSFLVDGDEITLRGYCRREGVRKIGFGACSGEIRPTHHVQEVLS